MSTSRDYQVTEDQVREAALDLVQYLRETHKLPKKITEEEEALNWILKDCPVLGGANSLQQTPDQESSRTIQVRQGDVSMKGSVHFFRGDTYPVKGRVENGRVYGYNYYKVEGDTSLRCDVFVSDLEDEDAESYYPSLLASFLSNTRRVEELVHRLEWQAPSTESEASPKAWTANVDSEKQSDLWATFQSQQRGLDEVFPIDGVLLSYGGKLLCNVTRDDQGRILWDENWLGANGRMLASVQMEFIKGLPHKMTLANYLPGSDVLIRHGVLTMEVGPSLVDKPWIPWSLEEGEALHEVRGKREGGILPPAKRPNDSDGKDH